MSKFVHLHVHTEYSLLDGAARIEKLVKTCKEHNMPAVAITDHGNMYGAIPFYEECKKAGIKPVFGCEFYVSDNLKVKQKQKEAHLVVLAKNEEGYKNMCRLNTIAFRDGFYYRPRIDYKTLEEHKDGLVVLSACVAGDIPQLILKRDYDGAEKLVKWFKDVFGEDFYIELQNHGLEEQKEVNPKLKEYAKKYNIKLVATNDVHYIYKEDAEMQDVLMCIQMGKTLDDQNRLKFSCDEFYLKTYEEMLKVFPEDEEALHNTLEVVDKCNYEFKFGTYMFPRYETPDGSKPEDFLRRLVNEGIIKKYKKHTPEIDDRVKRELDLIEAQGFVEYFLVVWDYIHFAEQKGIAVGPGRGSGAGSVVAYTIGITNVDPLKYNLLFERFIHSERVSAPDFDVDFASDRIDEIIQYVKQKYGEDRVVKIITFGTMAAKAAIKDVARVLNVPYSEVDKITKSIPNDYKRPSIIKKAFGLYSAKEGHKDFGKTFGIDFLKEMYENDPKIKRVVDIAIKLEDMPRQCSTHACGVVIGRDNLEDLMPLNRNGEDITTQYNMTDIEKLGHLKMDFLALKNLTDIQKCIQYVKENHGVNIDFNEMDYNDPEVFKLISTGNTKALFQIESGGFQKFMKQLKPTGIEDIIAGISLYRPGPMESIPRFVKNKHNPSETKYDHPILENIIDVTYGCIVYQEQVMRIVQDMAGYTLGQADMVRRMMGKKKPEAMAAEKKVFLYGKPAENGKPAIDGAVKRGVPEDVAEKIWGEMETFALYAFNKSHAAAYSVLAYQTAYLKRYYEAEFLTAVLNNRITNADEVKNYTNYAREEKIKVLPPDINKSETYFSVKNKQIRYGLAALKGVGEAVCNSIIKERNENGPYKNIMDFLMRTSDFSLNKRTIESMIYSGAFDCFGKKRSQFAIVYENAMERAIKDRKSKKSGQFSMFGEILPSEAETDLTYPDIPEFDSFTKLKKEKEFLGMYVSGHPLENYIEKMKVFNFDASMIEELYNDEMAENGEENEEHQLMNQSENGITDGMQVVCGGIITDIHKVFSRNGNKPMAIIKVEDLNGSLEVMVFNKLFEKLRFELVTDKMVTINGKLSLRSGERPIIIAENILFWNNNEQSAQKMLAEGALKEDDEKKNKKLFLRCSMENGKLSNELTDLLDNYTGDTPVLVQFENKLYDTKLRINPNNTIMCELANLIGEKNIKLK